MSNNCLEYVLDDLMAVTCIPVTKSPKSDTTRPTHYLGKTFGYDFPRSGLFDAATTVIGLSKAVKVETISNKEVSTPVGKLIPIRRFTGKAKDDTSDSVAGRLHTVKVSCEVDDREAGVWEDLLTLERTPCHLLLTFRDGTTQGFAAATADTYVCEVERDGAKTSVAFRIQNLMGIQLIA